VRPGNTYGSFAVQAGGAVGAYLIGRWTGHSKLTAAGLDVIRAQVVTQAWVQTLKLSANRQRPDGTRFSFPSGHVASSFATAGIVQREFGWKVALPFYGLGTYVASARMAQNHHYLSDVIFGASIGLASAHSLQIRSGNHALAVSPGAVGSGIGVNFRLVNRH
jgi:membrane-associated phospholipid phosphatase